MSERLNRLAPLSGVVFFILLVVAIFSSGSSPGAGSSGAKVIAFYTHHRSGQRASDVLFVFASAFLLMFAGVFRDRVREGAEGAATTALVGAGVLAAGLAILSSLDYALAAHPAQLTVSTAQALNTISNDGFFTAVMGGLVFGICSGIAVLRASVLPRWLGVLALIFGIAAATPASFAGLAGMALWTLVASIMLYVRTAGRNEARTAPVPAGAH
jgi:hypothetical protein